MTTALRLNARLDPELARKLAELEKHSGKSATEIVRSALIRYYDDELGSQSPFDAFQKSGLVGCASGPPTLSSNYKAALGRGLRKKHKR